MRFIVLVCCLLKSYRFLQILQLEHYDVKKYLNYCYTNYVYYNLISFLCLLTFLNFNNDLLRLVLTFILFVFLALSTLSTIVKLKYTSKIKRIYLVLIPIFIIGLYLNGFNLIIYFLLFEFILLVPFYINKPYDYYRNKKYLESSSKKYNNSNCIKIGVTGSFGKTSTKNIINKLLGVDMLGEASYKSYNTVLGISSFINNIPCEAYDYIVLEYGANKLGDIKEIKKYFEIDIACITEIGYMHLDTFKSLDNIVEEKFSLLENAKFAILNYEQELIRNHKVNIPFLSYGFNYGDVRANNIALGKEKTEFDLLIRDEFILRVNTKLIGKHQVLNLLCGICVLLHLNYDIKKCEDAINELVNTKSRLTFKTYEKYEIIDDSYNSNLQGSINALEILNTSDYKKVLITPGYVENSEVEDQLYTLYSNKIIEVNPFVILVGFTQTRKLQELLKDKVELVIVNSFKQAMVKVNEIEEYSTVLIENDLPDNYRGII